MKRIIYIATAFLFALSVQQVRASNLEDLKGDNKKKNTTVNNKSELKETENYSEALTIAKPNQFIEENENINGGATTVPTAPLNDNDKPNNTVPTPSSNDNKKPKNEDNENNDQALTQAPTPPSNNTEKEKPKENKPSKQVVIEKKDKENAVEMSKKNENTFQGKSLMGEDEQAEQEYKETWKFRNFKSMAMLKGFIKTVKVPVKKENTDKKESLPASNAPKSITKDLKETDEKVSDNKKDTKKEASKPTSNNKIDSKKTEEKAVEKKEGKKSTGSKATSNNKIVKKVEKKKVNHGQYKVSVCWWINDAYLKNDAFPKTISLREMKEAKTKTKEFFKSGVTLKDNYEGGKLLFGGLKYIQMDEYQKPLPKDKQKDISPTNILQKDDFKGIFDMGFTPAPNWYKHKVEVRFFNKKTEKIETKTVEKAAKKYTLFNPAGTYSIEAILLHLYQQFEEKQKIVNFFG